VKNPISVFQIKKKSEEFNSAPGGGNPAFTCVTFFKIVDDIGLAYICLGQTHGIGCQKTLIVYTNNKCPLIYVQSLKCME
jgi:hypothetical protein